MSDQSNGRSPADPIAEWASKQCHYCGGAIGLARALAIINAERIESRGGTRPGGPAESIERIERAILAAFHAETGANDPGHHPNYWNDYHPEGCATCSVCPACFRPRRPDQMPDGPNTTCTRCTT